jgi:hypothetical protein
LGGGCRCRHWRHGSPLGSGRGHDGQSEDWRTLTGIRGAGTLFVQTETRRMVPGHEVSRNRALPHFRWRRCHSGPKPPRISSKWGLLCEFAAADHQNCGRARNRTHFPVLIGPFVGEPGRTPIHSVPLDSCGPGLPGALARATRIVILALCSGCDVLPIGAVTIEPDPVRSGVA